MMRHAYQTPLRRKARVIATSAAAFWLPLLLVITAPSSYAQAQQPLGGAMLQAPALTSTPAPTSAVSVQSVMQPVQASPAPVATTVSSSEQPAAQAEPVQVGDVTRLLLDAQADGRAAGPRLPMLGDVATAGYKRYIDSFGNKIPEFFAEKVKDSSSGS